MTSVSLSDLKAKRAAMTQGEWAADRVLGMPRDDEPILANVIALELDSHGRQQQIADCYDNTLCPDKQCEANAAGIVATHNAADVLIEIAEAALDRAYAECSCGAELGCFPDCTREIAGQRLVAALAKIKP